MWVAQIDGHHGPTTGLSVKLLTSAPYRKISGQPVYVTPWEEPPPKTSGWGI